ncbi:hypothetical protein Rsub_05344 [Raphidocelis subcapitata]|uniref:Protein kinase domain-containing protein n=1 Tax=Raphidocelis subcapitata TaxID=307507 RepID=A0A2V0NXA4_9CHLO|nr:hypothetical protein Rsub_05344 [Raphidocelis subcapitata]|eukprot:GBF92261.1 hypothetical protein Rsub_05344 [Raphidocelis subcapitata]
MKPAEIHPRGIVDAPGCMITWDNAVVLDERPWPGGPEPLCQEVALVEIIAGGAVASLVVKDVQEAYLEADEGKMEQVCNEIEFHGDRVTLRQCRSLGIVPLLHACTKEGMVTQYYEHGGTTLDALFLGNRAALPADPRAALTTPEEMWEALGMGRRLALAVPVIWKLLRRLEWLHKKGVVHRDLKPGNLCIDASQELRFIDCGGLYCSRKLRAPRRGKRAGGHAEVRPEPVPCCTWRYLSPEGWVALDDQEHAEGWPELWAPLSRPAADYLTHPCIDVWAAGVTAYELLTGVPPFGVLEHHEASEGQCHEWLGSDVTRVHPQIHGDWPAPIAEVLNGMLQKHPDARWSAARCVQRLRSGGFAPGGEGWEAAAAEAELIAAADAEAAEAEAAAAEAEAIEAEAEEGSDEDAAGGDCAPLSPSDSLALAPVDGAPEAEGSEVDAPLSGRSSPLRTAVETDAGAAAWAALEARAAELRAESEALAAREREVAERDAAAAAMEAALVEREQVLEAEEARMRAVRAGLDRGNTKLSALAASLGDKFSAANSAVIARVEALRDAEAAATRTAEVEARRDALCRLRAQLAAKAEALQQARASCELLRSQEADPDNPSDCDAAPTSANARRKGRGAAFKKHAKAFAKALFSTNEGWACGDDGGNGDGGCTQEAPSSGAKPKSAASPLQPRPRASASGCMPLLRLFRGAGRGSSKKAACASDASGSSSSSTTTTSDCSSGQQSDEASQGDCLAIVLAVEPPPGAPLAADAVAHKVMGCDKETKAKRGKAALAESFSKVRRLFARRPHCASASP